MMDFLRDDLPVASTMPLTETKYKAKLDQNESPLDLPEDVKSAILEEFMRIEFNRYPQPHTYQETKEIFSQYAGVPKENFAITVGADQGIWLSFFLAGGACRKAIVYEPTYPIFKHAAKLTQTYLVSINLGVDYRIDPKTFQGYNVITIVNPNNPTGNLQEDEVVFKALETGNLVALDEAYFPFSGKTFANYIDEYPNLFVIRSLSKSLLAGIRIGYVIANSKVISLVEEILTAPYHLNSLQLAVLRQFSKVEPIYRRSIELVEREKRRLYKAFEQLGIRYHPSHGNFILFFVGDAERIYGKLLEHGIRVRNVSGMPGLNGYLRVTVGTERENDEFIKALSDILS